jgi:hypothetical protein
MVVSAAIWNKKMTQNYVRNFYIEIVLLVIVTGLCVLSVKQIGLNYSSSCDVGIWNVVPYIYFHGAELCGHKAIFVAITLYYMIAVTIILIFQYQYITGRGPLEIIHKGRYLFVLFLFVYILFAWIVGRSSNNGLFNFTFHRPEAWGVFTIPVLVPSFQFILTILMLKERE